MTPFTFKADVYKPEHRKLNTIFLKKRICLVFLVILSCLPVMAQDNDSVYVVQYVSDSFTKHGIPEACITLADTNGISKDIVWTNRGVRSPHAQVWVAKVARKPQVFLIKAEHPDYETVVQRLELKNLNRKEEYLFPDLFMKRKMKETTLNEVTVSATRVQIAYKGDTIVVNADAFKIPEGSMLDALVASVPGAELRDDGTIYMNGRKVDYLTLNGKDFFKGKNRIMLDNLPYYIVSKLKFYEKDVPRSQMIHQDTWKKDYVMDVELKKEYSIGYTANAEAGIGTKEKWLGRLFGLRFTDNSRVVLFAGANNTNEVRGPGAEGWNAQSKLVTGEKEKEMVGGSIYVEDKNNRYKENVEVQVNWEDDKDETRTAKETFMAGSQEYSRARNISNSRQFNNFLHNRLELKKFGLFFDTHSNYYKENGGRLSQSASFTSDPSGYGSCIQVLDSLFSTTINPLSKNICINSVLDNTKYNISGYAFNQGISWEKTLPNGDDVLLTTRADYNKEDKDDFSLYNLNYPSAGRNGDNQNRYTPYSKHEYRFQASGSYYLHLPHRWNLGTTIGYDQHYINSESSLYRLDKIGYDAELGMLPSQAVYLQTVDVGNSYRSQYMTRDNKNDFFINHNYDGSKSRIYATVSAAIVYSNESVRYWRSSLRSDLCKSNWYVEPTISVECESDSLFMKNYQFEYRCSVRTPNLIQMLDVKDTSDPLSVILGNPDLQTSRVHRFELSMDNAQWEKFFRLKLTTNILDNMVANGFTYNQQSGVYTYRPENVKGNWNASIGTFYNKTIGKQKRYKFEGGTNFDYVHNVDLARVEGFLESQLSRVNHYITSQNLKMSYNKESLRLEFGGNFAWNVAIRELNDATNISAFDFSYGLSGQYTFPWKIQFATDLKMYGRRGYEERSMNTNELVWNASVSRPFIKGRLTVKVDAFDILGQRSSTRYVVNGQGRTETWQLCMPRYAMLKVAYKFNKNPKKK